MPTKDPPKVGDDEAMRQLKEGASRAKEALQKGRLTEPETPSPLPTKRGRKPGSKNKPRPSITR